ncbi:MAG: hypothetical protein HC836_41860, partial [Richelia sp. RM2_1_2]|nr:hypothetical protein [Richelia sp. RM2_1_2]
MIACEQTKGMSVYDHGILVNEYYHDLMNHLSKGTSLKFKWRLPEWIDSYSLLILAKTYDSDIMNKYQVFHDCGKPYCRTVDADGKQHFPDHANVSYEIWTKVFPDENPLIGQLIKSDMDIHLLKAEGLESFCERPEAISLLITGLSEI